MIKTNSREGGDYTNKQEGSTSDNIGSKQIISSRPSSATTTTSSWSRLKDPRIVRVSRAFGGKDRHSKVCTVRGLRDRRVRLSVPTAIQLYDLQDRLGLNQPSKVVDWLLNAAKHEIDELPPLQMPPGNYFGQSFQPLMPPHDHESDKLQALKMNSSLNWEDDPLALSRSSYWNSDKSKEVAIARDAKRDHEEVGIRKQAAGNGDQEGDHRDDDDAFVSSSNFFSRSNPSSSVPAGLLNNIIPNSSFLRWDPSNLTLSQFGTPHQTEDAHGFNVVPLPSTSIPSGSHQLLVYPPQTQSYFPSHIGNNPSGEINFQMLSSSTTNSQNRLSSTSTTSLPLPIYTISQGMRPFHLSMNPKYFPSHNSNENDQPNKDP